MINSHFSIAEGVTLTIEPGTIIKARTIALGGPSIYGTLKALGTPEQPIYFTSFLDDSVGGDSDGHGPSIGEPGQWQGLYFKPGSVGEFDHVVLRYAGNGGFGFGNFVGIENDGGAIDIKNSHIIDNYRFLQGHKNGHGIWQRNGDLNIENSILSNQVFGLTMWGGAVSVSSSDFSSNTVSGIHAPFGDSLTLTNNTFTNNAKTGYIAMGIDFSHTGNTSTDMSNRGFETSGNISRDKIWHSDDLPLIPYGVTVEPGVSLTLSPGTVLKMGLNSYVIEVYGSLIAQGTESQPVHFTSLKDDTVAGDTNGNGTASSPNATNWAGIVFHPGSVGDITDSVIRYSGGPSGFGNDSGRSGIFNLGGTLSIEKVSFSDNFTTDVYQNAGSLTVLNADFSDRNFGLISDGGEATISQSRFATTTGGIENKSVEMLVDARHNWWGSDTGPRIASNPAGAGGAIFGNVLYDPWLASDPSLEPEEQNIDPVIIVPGIMGSAYKNGELVIDPILHTYDDLIATLIANGYVEGEDLFTFPYEWRDSNVLTASFLRNRINAKKEICECDKVDIVAHSMGGLVARQYIQSAHYADDVDQLIFLGVPHKGSQASYLRWEAGEFEAGTFNFLTKKFFEAEARKNGFVNIFDYVRNRPIESVEELLPDSDYLKDKETSIVREYPNNYPRNIFLEDLNTSISDLFDEDIDITNIIGNSGDNTIEKIRVVTSSDSGLWVHGQPDGFYDDDDSLDNGLERGFGDTTVTIDSASLDDSVSHITKSSGHRAIVSDSSADVYKILTGEDADIVIDDKKFPSVTVALFQLLSPIDVLITAPDGKKIGKNFETGEEYDEIPFAFYSGFETDDEFVTILNPLDGEYKIEIQGVDGGGEYGVLTSYISDEVSITEEISGLTDSGQVTLLNVEVDNNNPENLEPEKLVTLEVLLNDILKAYELGWITDDKLKDRLIKQIGVIMKIEGKIEKVIEKDKKNKDKKVEKLELKIDKKLAKALLVQLKAYKKDKINKQAYNIIKEDLEWLINN